MLFKGQSYTHQQVNGRSRIFAPALLRRRRPKGFVMWLGRKDGLRLMVERVPSLFTQWWFYHMETHWQNFWFTLHPSTAPPPAPPCALPKNVTPCEGKDISFWLLFFSFDELKRLICQPVSHESRKKKHLISDLLLFFLIIIHSNRQEAGAKDSVDCHIVSEAYRKSSFLIRARWCCVRDPSTSVGFQWSKTLYPIVAEETWSISWKPLPQTGSWRRYCGRRKRGNGVLFLCPTMGK